MTPQRTGQLISEYYHALINSGANPRGERCGLDDIIDFTDADRAKNHAVWMCIQAEKMTLYPNPTTEDWLKGNRWLGFIQGVLWLTGLFTINDMRRHVKEGFDGEAHARPAAG